MTIQTQLRVCNLAYALILDKSKPEHERFDQCFAYLEELRRSGTIDFADFNACWKKAVKKAEEARDEGLINERSK